MEEIWKDIENFEGLYRISSFGKVESLSRSIKSPNGFRTMKGRILAPRYTHGYIHVQLCKHGNNYNFYVHSLVANTFLSKENCNLVVNHKDGNKQNNNVSNLEWITQKQNIHHAIETGLTKISGENSHFHKLNKEEVLNIRKLFSEGNSLLELATKFNVTKATTCRIVNNKIWKQ